MLGKGLCLFEPRIAPLGYWFVTGSQAEKRPVGLVGDLQQDFVGNGDMDIDKKQPYSLPLVKPPII